MHLRSFVLLPAALSLAACATPAPAPPVSGQCNADAASAYIGKMPDDATAEAARKAAGAERVRTLQHGQMVTMEYLAGRLNLYLDTGGKIERIGCG